MKEITAFQGEYRWLSNFWPARVTLCDDIRPNLIYPTVEHAYQAAKSLDWVDRVQIQEAKSPGKAKRRGCCVKLRSDWNDVRLRVMEELLRQKFLSGTDANHLGKLLLGTGEARLIEGNTWGDRFWGAELLAVARHRDGAGPGAPGADEGHDNHEWNGANHLGRLLMQVRGELRLTPHEAPN